MGGLGLRNKGDVRTVLELACGAACVRLLGDCTEFSGSVD